MTADAVHPPRVDAVQDVLRVIAEICVEECRRSPAGSSALARWTDIAAGADVPVDVTFADLGLDSLSWLSVLTALEERLDVRLSDHLVTTPAATTPLGLAAITAATDQHVPSATTPNHPSAKETS